MLPTTTSQATTLADSEYAQKRREIYRLLKKLTDLVGYVFRLYDRLLLIW